MTAFNTGTGVIPEFRGQQLVDRLYAFALPFFQEANITNCALEVIQENARAIRVYERIGFSKKRGLLSYKGELAIPMPQKVTIQLVPFQYIQSGLSEHALYAWDFNNEALLVLQDTYQAYMVTNSSNHIVGYFLINPSNNMVAQIESATKDISALLSGIRQVTPTIRIVNVDESRTDLIKNLVVCGLENTVNQFEMEMNLK